jgi:hypothetical protein
MGSNVKNLISQVEALGPVEPEDRVALRMAAHRVPTYHEHVPRFIGPREADRPWWTATELAAWLRVHPQTVHAMCRDGVFGPANAFQLYNRRGSEWRIRVTAIAAWYRDAMAVAA